MCKRLLFLKATNDYEQQLVDHLKSVCSLLAVDFIEHQYADLSSFESYAKTAGKFDCLYIAAHGDHRCFGDAKDTRWADFAIVLCRAEVMNPNSIIFMGCCYGGLKRVALILFVSCPQITSVCGPKWTVDTANVPVALHTFLYNLLIAKEEPILAAERASASIGLSFPIYDRHELEAEVALMSNMLGIDPEWLADYQPSQQYLPLPYEGHSKVVLKGLV
jgi:hypothetical protein